MKTVGFSIVITIATLSGVLSATMLEARLQLQSAATKPGPVPEFDDYPVAEEFRGVPAPVQLRSAPYGDTFRTRLREGARGGPNFAGNFTVVNWGCGAPCQMVAIIDVRSRRLLARYSTPILFDRAIRRSVPPVERQRHTSGIRCR